MTKILFVLIFATVSSVAMAQVSESVVEKAVVVESVGAATQQCEAPKPLAARKSLAPKPTQQAAVLPAVGWPDSVVWGLGGAVLLLGLIVAFLLGRATAPVAHQPQMIAPVVYVQPPPAPAPPRVP